MTFKGRTVLLAMLGGVILVTVLTLGGYFATRQLDYIPTEDRTATAVAEQTAGVTPTGTPTVPVSIATPASTESVPEAIAEIPDETCPASYGVYYSPVIDMSFCHPPDWQVTQDVSPLPESEAPDEGYWAGIVLLKPHDVRYGLASVNFTFVVAPWSEESYTAAHACEDYLQFNLSSDAARLCVHDDEPVATKGADRVIGFALEHRSDVQGLISLSQTPAASGSGSWTGFDPQAQVEALTILASLRSGPR